ncbi:NADP-dependent phosphogluconate dehydrogenase [Clostridium estertheticum]|uniref:6-phosphogluconate dehydrogenase, decarboxylating n=1 Tax=Clostridium estertheticum subsp. estertheticum TaxID=1552 RepID=A0A1J0GEN5_9CLOT|nr:NADP-dependent phosphogluconate dehydrogenase [Clostridium estertheticum]APC39789.1 phosphogluconate dehydrogenase (NADP(+)-dependent, decarboxylating) [Clostridium estertheticum subsp. estertheticum]MBU3075791.1 NADP-dependent phosphogluconate dehydrogenase [Clostridium estertheticum]MBU3165721.1 NADP-dependent phosphogluconate dehydrogenase [Clostridium estertheticum]MBU3172049.1 NADP-dependent phosphogluconate dehydrogenase [Clostridium estertheticum]MBU3185042.1 NADP-dependent phosphogl
MKKQQFGVLGIAVMGKNLALNVESRGISVCVYSRNRNTIDEFLIEAKGKNIKGAYSIEEFVNSLETPRKILIMIKAGLPVDETIDKLIPYISKGDILIDGGNSYFMDTIRRSKKLEELGFKFIGTGVSGGEEGALKGPAIMPGGEQDAYKIVEPIFTAISAKVDGEACCTYIGTNGAGHYVKMVHNGIEYGDMQLICEAYALLKGVVGLTNDEIHDVFEQWNKGELNSYLIEITSEIFSQKDNETGEYIVDIILDKAGQKGTGKWTSQSALDLAVPIPSITEAVFARCMSSLKDERIYASSLLKGPDVKFKGDKKDFIEAVRRALYTSKICSYAQGFALMRVASKEYNWDLKYGKIAKIFRGGCIIRAQFLNKINEAYENDENLNNLMLDSYFNNIINSYQKDLRYVISTAVNLGVPVPSFSSALTYYDSYRSANLPANLLQAQRDYFGAHTFERVDKEGTFHHEWVSKTKK